MDKIFRMDVPQFNGIFNFLANQISEVVWVCTGDYKKQLYISPSFETVWGRSTEVMYDHLEIWPRTLLQEDLTAALPGFHARVEGSSNPTLVYRIHKPDGKICFIKDSCIDLKDEHGERTAVVGLAKPISEIEWEQHSKNKIGKDHETDRVNKDLINIFSKELKLTGEAVSNKNESFSKIRYWILVDGEVIDLTKKEALCLSHLLHGKSFKMIARLLDISPRTVETHINHIKQKLRCTRSLELLSKIQNQKEIANWSFT